MYRVPNSVQIKDFASQLEKAIRAILPAKSTIDLLLDDGSPAISSKSTGSKRQGVGGPAIEPVKIKVTPLRPLFKMEDNDKCFRGSKLSKELSACFVSHHTSLTHASGIASKAPEWFQQRAEEQEFNADAEASGRGSGVSLHHRSISTSTTNSISSHGSVTMASKRSATFRSSSRKSSTAPQYGFAHNFDRSANEELIGVDRFYFTQPIKRDPVRGFRDWLKVPKGSIAERSLRVTELQVEGTFPACITRQKIIHRAVFTQSPLEASVEAVSTWCSVLFRTVIATNGQGVLGKPPHIISLVSSPIRLFSLTCAYCVLGGQRRQGLSADSAKLLMECIHSSGIKRIGQTFLSSNSSSEESNTEMYRPYESLNEEEIERVQTKLARMIVTFLELLHLLIARNRDVLLTVVQAKKQGRPCDASSVHSGSVHGGYAATPRAGSHTFGSPLKRFQGEGFMYDRSHSEIMGRSILADSHSHHGQMSSGASDRTGSAINVQSELQRGLISLVKSLSPHLLDTLTNEVPRWMRSCCQDNYFSTGQYRNADIRKSNVLCPFLFAVAASDCLPQFISHRRGALLQRGHQWR